MPVGYENSAMKMSFSLSSLQPSSASLESPEHARLRSERPYNSLTKKPRKDPQQEKWRRSWGSREENQDDFWAALQPNYAYLMDSQLMDSCMSDVASGNGEFSSEAAVLLGELAELKTQFSELYAWLDLVRDGAYGEDDALIDRSQRVSHMEEMQRNSFRRQSFNAKSASLLERSPRLGEEVSWRVSHLNSKWEMLEQALTPVKTVGHSPDDAGTDVEHEVRCLRKWLAEMDVRLQPLEFRVTGGWSTQELDEKTREHMVLQRDIESHGKIVSSVVKLLERASRSKQRRGRRGRRSGGCSGGEDPTTVARSLESRWHHLCLRSLEWTCMIEALAEKLRNRSPSIQSSDSDEGPASKYPRLSGDHVRRNTTSSTASSIDGEFCSSEVYSSEDDADAVMDTSEPAINASMPEPEGATLQRSAQGKKRRNAKGAEMSPPRVSEVNENVATAWRSGGSSFNKSNREAPNYATFYFKHLDTDSEQDAAGRKQDSKALDSGSEKHLSPGSGNDKSPLEESSEEEWTFTNGTNGKIDTSGSSSEAANSRKSHRKKRPVAVRLDFSEDQNSVDETNMLVNKNNQKTNSVVSRKVPWKSSRESIQRLVIRADEMVMSTNKTSALRTFEPLVFSDLKPASFEAKTERITEWLKLHPQEAVDHPVDSCDASGEYTTGDSEDDKQSDSSEDVNVSVATCRQVDVLLGCSRSNSSDAILEAEVSEDTASPLRTPTHVVLRSRRRQAERPWSVSGLGQLIDIGVVGGEQLAHFSISESALNQIVAGSTSPQGKAPMLGSALMNNSSSTIDGTLMGVEVAGSGSRTGSLRRRKLRLKKRTMGRKSESGSDGVTVGHSNSGGSDSQQQSKPIIQSLAIDSSPRTSTSKSRNKSSTSDSMLKDTSSDDDERVSRRPMPTFKLGPEGGSVSFLDSKKLSLAVDEHHSHHSALSEQAWDNYQEKYMSEPYSEELADSEAARRLLEFGDDYRNFLDSQSDCASSLGAHHAGTPPRRRKPQAGTGDQRMDSDSDLEDIRHVIQQSQAQLVFTEHVFGKQLANASPQLILAMDFAEIGATCRENVNCLHLVLDNVDEGDAGLLSAHECRDIRGLVERWEMLQVKSEDLQRVRGLQKEMVVLKDELLNLASRVDGVETNLQDRDHLERTINQVKTELSGLRDRKSKLLEMNVAVHRFLTDTGHPAAILKDDVADLYRVWDETYHIVSQRLTHLQTVFTSLAQFDAHLTELQLALRADQATLRMLDSALQGGADVTGDVATSIRDVAKVLSEKRERLHEALCTQNGTLVDDSTPSGNTNPLLTSTLSTEGSLSDSGISDEGSEQELSERERRLETLRRLARHLETVLAPGSAVLLNMAMRIEQTENELRGLQSTCKDLIVRTAVCVEARAAGVVLPAVAPPATSTPKLKPSPRSSRRSSINKRQMLGANVSASPDGDDDDPDKSRSWLWRIMRSALPFQMALVALFCVACLLEPHCCDSMNSSFLSFTPQLRYLRGPPPV